MQVEQKILSIGMAITALLILFLSVFSPKKVWADSYQPGEEERRISVDKKVRSVDSETFYNNIESTQKIFKEGDIIEFSIAIENSGKLTLNNIDVNDQLPNNLSLIFYPGTWDRTNNKINWKIDALNPAEVKTYYIRAKIAFTDKLDLTQGNPAKLTNYVSARSDTGTSADDRASYFVGQGTTSIPKTGSNLPLQTAIVLMTGTIGVLFRKFARGY